MRTLWIVVAALAACGTPASPDTPDALHQVRLQVETFEARVESARDLGDVDQALDAYDEGARRAMSDLAQAMGDCPHHMAMLEEEVESLLAVHGAHDSRQACVEATDAHAAHMHAALDKMAAHHGEGEMACDGDMPCEGHGAHHGEGEMPCDGEGGGQHGH